MEVVSGVVVGILASNALANFAVGYNAAQFAERSVYMPELKMSEGFVGQYLPNSFSSAAFAGTYYLENYASKDLLAKNYFSYLPFLVSIIEPTFYWLGALCSGKVSYCIRNKFLSVFGSRHRTKGLLPFYIPSQVDFQSQTSYRQVAPESPHAQLSHQRTEDEIINDFSNQLRFSTYKEKVNKANFLVNNQVTEEETKELINIEEKGENITIDIKTLESRWEKIKYSYMNEVTYAYDQNTNPTKDKLPFFLKNYLQRKLDQGATFTLVESDSRLCSMIKDLFNEDRNQRLTVSDKKPLLKKTLLKEFYLGKGKKVSFIQEGGIVRLHLERNGLIDRMRLHRKNDEKNAFFESLQQLVGKELANIHFSSDIDDLDLINEIINLESLKDKPIHFFDIKSKFKYQNFNSKNMNFIFHNMEFTDRVEKKDSYLKGYLRDIGAYAYSILKEGFPKNKNFLTGLYFLFKFLTANIWKCLINVLFMAILLPFALRKFKTDDLLSRLYTCKDETPHLFGNKIKIKYHQAPAKKKQSVQKEQAIVTQRKSFSFHVNDSNNCKSQEFSPKELLDIIRRNAQRKSIR